MADPQHPDIAALVERLDAKALHGLPTATEWLIRQAAAALRALARPVEDEEVRGLLPLLKRHGEWLREQTHHLAAIAVEEAASLLARLAREKASAEQERDALRLGTEELSRQVGFHVGRELDERDRATRAEQEIARLLDEMRKIADVGKNRRTGETGYMGEHHAECQAIAERALAAAAGAEEPR